MADVTAAVFLMLVTWFGSGGVSSYQVEFADRALCERAIDALAAEQSRLQQDVPTAEPASRSSVQVQTGGIIDPARPFVAAVCVQQR
jgi:hypothetical protein